MWTENRACPEFINLVVHNSKHEALRSCRSSFAWRACAAVAGRAHDSAGYGDFRERALPLRRAGTALAAERSFLVPGPGLRNGNGLALFRNHNVSDGRPEARTESARARARHLRLRRTRKTFTQDSGRDCAQWPISESLNGDELARTSRLTAKIDNNAIADGFQLYLHSFVVSKAGEWTVVQQGMNDATGLARRYHWHSATVRDFTSEPHTAIVGESVIAGSIMNLVDSQAKAAQAALLEIARENPERTLREVPRLTMPAHHDVREKDIDLKRLGAVLAVAYEKQLRDFANLLLLENLGPRTLQSLALIAEVVHGTPTRFSDPARFSFAHGGKDGHPFPVPLKTYDESLSVLRRALQQAKVGHTEKFTASAGLIALPAWWRNRVEPEADFEAALAHERAISPSLDGRTVFDDRKPKTRKKI